MSHQISPFASFSSHRTNTPLFVVILMVIVMHLVLLFLGTFWNPAPPAPKPRSKVIVQTVRLKPFQANTIQNPTISTTASLPIVAPSPIPTSIEPQPQVETPIPQLPKEESPPPSEIAMQKEEIPLTQEIPVPKEEILPVKETPIQKEEPVVVAEPDPVPTPPPPAKVESAPQSKPTPKPQEKPKTKAKQSAPVKKTVEPVKKAVKKDNVKSKEAEEATKKRQQQEQAEKKRQQEKAEAEKKRQQEAEKKRQQEIAAAQEVAKQKLAKAKENLAKISETSNKMGSSSSVNLETTALPKELGSLQVDTLSIGDAGGSGEWGTREASYSDEVAYRLKMALKLPDYGAVKIKLTLDRTGKVVKVEILQSESSKNKVYIESKIPTLLFPSFGQRFQGVSQNTFVITLQNDS